MTPTDEVKKVAYDILPDGAVRSRELIRELIASAITSAVEAERERCAKVAEKYGCGEDGYSHSCCSTHEQIAKELRQTPTKEERCSASE